jgi:hypothetical protein
MNPGYIYLNLFKRTHLSNYMANPGLKMPGQGPIRKPTLIIL